MQQKSFCEHFFRPFLDDSKWLERLKLRLKFILQKGSVPPRAKSHADRMCGQNSFLFLITDKTRCGKNKNKIIFSFKSPAYTTPLNLA
jgi:hypothetical protein